MTTREQEMQEICIWEKACERVGKWIHERGQHSWPLCPPVGDPVCVVAMLDYALARIGWSGLAEEVRGPWIIGLATVIKDLPEES